jgi:hypothetical protein
MNFRHDLALTQMTYPGRLLLVLDESGRAAANGDWTRRGGNRLHSVLLGGRSYGYRSRRSRTVS